MIWRTKFRDVYKLPGRKSVPEVKAVITADFPAFLFTPEPLPQVDSASSLICAVALASKRDSFPFTCLKVIWCKACPVLFCFVFLIIIYLFTYLQWLSVAWCISPNFSAVFLHLLSLRAAQARAGEGCSPPPTCSILTTSPFHPTGICPSFPSHRF